MKSRQWAGLFRLWGVWAAMCIPAACTAAEHDLEHDHAHDRRFATAPALRSDPADSGRHYAPDRLVDVLHVKIDVTPDFRKRAVAGTTTIRFKPIGSPLKQLRLHAVDLTISKVAGNVPIEAHTVDDEGLVITFAEPIAPDVEADVSVTHAAEPKAGLYFRTREMGYKAEDEHLWTQGEMHEARHWFPSFDYPNERFTTEMICRVPPDMKVFSNGRLVGEQVDAATGLKAVHWLQDKPHVNYLIALVAGHYKSLTGKYRDIPLAFHAPQSRIHLAENSFKDTADMMGFFEKVTGTPYPWARYDQAAVDDFHWGGMENTTLTILNARTLYPDDTGRIRSSQGLIAHELAHQWFGDYVTCQDWSHIWLNEGFATYYALLYDEHRNGRDSFLYGLYSDRQGIARQKADTMPTVYRQYGHPREQFSFRAYDKGSWILHMLRSQLGDDLYHRCIQEYLRRHAFTSTVTQDLIDVIEQLSGRSFAQFFDQWLYHGSIPDLVVTQSWDQAAKLAKVTVSQVQPTSDKVLLFSFPVTLRFVTEQGVVDHEVAVSKREQSFYVPLKSQPTVVRFDATMAVLAAVKFDKPKEMLYTQLALQDDVVGRLLAVDALAAHKDQQSIDKLKQALNGDGFYGVRIRAADALGEMRSNEAFAALAESLDQPDERVRQRVINALGGYYLEATPAKLSSVIEAEKNPYIVADALRALAPFNDEAVRGRLIEMLRSQSHNQMLAGAAINAIRRQDDPVYVEPLMAALRDREQELTSADFAEGLRTLGYIARHLDDRDAVRQMLAGHVNHPRRQIQQGAIEALGELRDVKATAIVETFDVGPAAAPDDSPVRRSAQAALKNLREAQKTPVELGELRGEVTKLKQANDQLRKEFDEVKAKLDAVLKREEAKPDADAK